MALRDKFGGPARHGVTGTASALIPIFPSDDDDLPDLARSIRCRPDGIGGSLRFTDLNGDVRDTYIAAGEVLHVMTVRVHNSGTAATLLEAFI